jgi:hypothetical protein
MSLERIVFAPVERAAETLRPHRWYVCLAASVAFGLALLLGALGAGLAPGLARAVALLVRVLATLAAWAWGAFMLSMAFAPPESRVGRSAEPAFMHLRGALSIPGRVWLLIVLAGFLILPVLGLFVLWPIAL